MHRPLHGSDLIKAFLGRESVLTPLDYVKQICFEQSQFYPIYFFIGQTKANLSEVIAELEKVDCRPTGKGKLIARLQASEKLTVGSLKTSSEAGKQTSRIFSELVSKSLTDGDAENNLRFFFYAITHLTKENSDPEFLLPLIGRVAMPRYSSLRSLDAIFMRKAVCHLDLILYKQSL